MQLTKQRTNVWLASLFWVQYGDESKTWVHLILQLQFILKKKKGDTSSIFSLVLTFYVCQIVTEFTYYAKPEHKRVENCVNPWHIHMCLLIKDWSRGSSYLSAQNRDTTLSIKIHSLGLGIPYIWVYSMLKRVSYKFSSWIMFHYMHRTQRCLQWSFRTSDCLSQWSWIHRRSSSCTLF